MILHNRSFETDCCDCCKDDSFARIPRPIMDSINNGLRQKIRSQTLYQKEKQKERYWICTKNMYHDFSPVSLSIKKDPSLHLSISCVSS